jgi:hypothetical protein
LQPPRVSTGGFYQACHIRQPGSFDAIKAALVEAVEAKHRRWLKDRLWNEPSLKDRLMQLVDHVGLDVVEAYHP